MQDIVKYSDFTTEKFLEVHTRMRKAVDTIKPIDEYKDFVGKHRWEIAKLKYSLNYIVFILIIN